jgi:hypothetical protein
MNPSPITISLPTSSFSSYLHEIGEMSSLFISNILIYLCYFIAILCGLKFMIYMLNGISSNTHMGSRSLDDSTFFR